MPADIVCPTCRGQKDVRCRPCRGTGFKQGAMGLRPVCPSCDGRRRVRCEMCEGRGTVANDDS